MTIYKSFTHDEVTGTQVGKYNLANNSKVHFYQLGDTLIDTGPPNEEQTVLNHLREKPLSQIILTHHHEDHSGNAKSIAAAMGIPVYMHASGIPIVQNGFSLRLYQKIFWGRTPRFSPEPYPETISTSTGNVLTPIHTPGHCVDHACLLEPDKKWLFSGDFYLATKMKMFRADEDLTGHIQSLHRILEYDFETIFCGHQGVVTDGHAKMEKKLEYLLELAQKVKNLHRQGRTEKEITLTLLGKSGAAGILSCNHMSCRNLVNQCLKAEI